MPLGLANHLYVIEKVRKIYLMISSFKLLVQTWMCFGGELISFEP